MGEMKERMLRGELYIADDEDLAADFSRAQEILERYNRSAFAEQPLRDRLPSRAARRLWRRRAHPAAVPSGVRDAGQYRRPDVLQLRLPDARCRAGHDRRRLSG